MRISFREASDLPVPYRCTPTPGTDCDGDGNGVGDSNGPVWPAGVLDVEPRGLGSASFDTFCTSVVEAVPVLLVVVVGAGIGEVD